MVQRALQKEPLRRYQTTDELLHDLKQLRLPPVRQMVFYSFIGVGLLTASLLGAKAFGPTLPGPATPSPAPTVTAIPTQEPVILPASAVVTASATPTPSPLPSVLPPRRATSTPVP